MISLRSPILATLVFYDCFDFPLTLVEIYKYLINPSRLLRVIGDIGEIKMSDIGAELERLEHSKIIEQENGFYFLSGRKGLYDLRIEREKIATQKWKKFLRLVRLLSAAPYLRGVFASGSMAINNTEPRSDFDVLIIVRSGRLYTSRLFLWIISSLLGARRKRFEKIAPDKLCFNHYITDGALTIRHESLFTAQSYANLKPVMIKESIIDDFYGANIWLYDYMYNFQPQKEFTRRTVQSPFVLKSISVFFEMLLSSPVGNWIETFLKNAQQKRIKNNPVTYKPGGRIIFTETELEFHPYSFEKLVLLKYNQRLKKLGIASLFEEKDSGLKV